MLSFVNLPLDILVNIFNKLNISDLRNMMLTCHTIRHLILNNNDVWRLLVHKHFTIKSTNNRSLLLYNQFRLSHNWRKGYFRSKVIIHQHINYMPWLRLYNQNLLLSLGSELHCYRLDKKGAPNQLWKIVIPKKTDVGVRTNDISRFLLKNNRIICGNRNGSVSVYNLKDIKNQPKLDYYINDCHNNGKIEVSTVEITETCHNSCIISGSNDSPVVKFWKPKISVCNYNGNLQSFKSGRNQSKQFQSERDISIGQCVGIRCLAMDKFESRLALGLNGNSKPFLLDIETGEGLLNVESSLNIRDVIRDIQWHDEHTVAFVTHSGLLQLIDTRSAQMVFQAIDPFCCTLYCVRTDGCKALVVGSSQHSRCVLYDIRHSLKHLQMFFTQSQTSPIYSLDFDPWKLIAAADRSVATLDFNVNAAMTVQRDNSFAFEHFSIS